MVTSAPVIPAWLAKLYPFAPQSFFTPRGARMSYVDVGPPADTAVLLLHGNPTWSFFYRDLIQKLSPQIRCIAPDHIGMGLSAKLQDYDYSLATRIDDIAALVAALGLRRVHLVVHDWGGAIGSGLAVRNPGLIGRITLLNTAAFVSDRIPWRISACRVPVFGPALVRGLNGFAGPATWMSLHRRSLSADERRGYLLPYDSWANRVAVSAFVQDIPLEPDHRSRETLAAVERGLPLLAAHKKLIVWGGRDFCFNDHFLARWRTIFPDATVRHLADAGHYVLDDGGDEVRAEIAAFILKEE
jgi:haloalkane dehalogenase